jgi:hypothetical protein
MFGEGFVAVAVGLFPPVPEGSPKGLSGDAFRTFRAVADAVDAVKVRVCPWPSLAPLVLPLCLHLCRALL